VFLEETMHAEEGRCESLIVSFLPHHLADERREVPYESLGRGSLGLPSTGHRPARATTGPIAASSCAERHRAKGDEVRRPLESWHRRGDVVHRDHRELDVGKPDHQLVPSFRVITEVVRVGAIGDQKDAAWREGTGGVLSQAAHDVPDPLSNVR
jgi:hypothetical protein